MARRSREISYTLRKSKDDMSTSPRKPKGELISIPKKSEDEMISTSSKTKDETGSTTRKSKNGSNSTLRTLPDEKGSIPKKSKDEMGFTPRKSNDVTGSTQKKTKCEMSSTPRTLKNEKSLNLIKSNKEISSTPGKPKDNVFSPPRKSKDETNSTPGKSKDEMARISREMSDKVRQLKALKEKKVKIGNNSSIAEIERVRDNKTKGFKTSSDESLDYNHSDKLASQKSNTRQKEGLYENGGVLFDHSRMHQLSSSDTDSISSIFSEGVSSSRYDSSNIVETSTSYDQTDDSTVNEVEVESSGDVDKQERSVLQSSFDCPSIDSPTALNTENYEKDSSEADKNQEKVNVPAGSKDQDMTAVKDKSLERSTSFNTEAGIETKGLYDCLYNYDFKYIPGSEDELRMTAGSKDEEMMTACTNKDLEEETNVPNTDARNETKGKWDLGYNYDIKDVTGVEYEEGMAAGKNKCLLEKIDVANTDVVISTKGK